MKISTVLESEENIILFADKLYDEYLEGNIPKNFFYDFLNSIDNEKVFIRWMLLNCTELTEYSIFSYEFDVTDELIQISRKDRLSLIDELSKDGIYNDVLYRIYEKYQSYKGY